MDFETAFDLARFLTEWGPADPRVQELAELSADSAGQVRVTEVARRVLADRYEPGFDVEPARLAALEEALEAVQTDMRATGLAGPVRVVIPDRAPQRCAFVEFRGNGYGSTPGIAPRETAGPLSALLAVADDARDAAAGTLHEVWPVCPARQLGAHPHERTSSPSAGATRTAVTSSRPSASGSSRAASAQLEPVTPSAPSSKGPRSYQSPGMTAQTILPW